MSAPRKARPARTPEEWEAFLPKELRRRIAFTVMVTNEAPHECGPLDVTLDPNGISMHWMGTERLPEFERWAGTWGDLRDLCALLRRRDTVVQELETYRRELQVARDVAAEVTPLFPSGAKRPEGA